jgi:tRNA (guanine37-N1)-methyltransferase
MVLKPEPFFAAVESIERNPASPVILMTPQGAPFKQADANAFAKETDITLLCGHYEGFDERIRSLCTHEISIGDFVLTGGELPALTIIDSVARLVPGVIGKLISVASESFVDGLLEGPQYTKPPVFRDMEVPEVLRSGNHREIEKWRRKQALLRTLKRRPDLISAAQLSKEEQKMLNEIRDTDNQTLG